MLISIDFFSLIHSLFDIFVLAVFHPSIHPFAYLIQGRGVVWRLSQLS